MRCRVSGSAAACFGAAMLAFAALPGWASASPASLKVPAASAYPRHGAHIVPVQAKTRTDDFRAGNIVGAAGRPLPVKIEMLEGGGKPSGQLFVFTGLPEGVRLSPGGNFGEFWAVNAAVIKDLTLTAPADYKGTFTVWITRSREKGKPAQSTSITVTVGQPAATQTAAAPPAIQPPPAPASALAPPSLPTSAPASNDEMLLVRAGENFVKGDVSGARAIYEYLALQGSAAAAMAMGETYDPLVLAKLVLKGLEADAATAEQWYEKAEELGNREARTRLNALAAR